MGIPIGSGAFGFERFRPDPVHDQLSGPVDRCQRGPDAGLGSDNRHIDTIDADGVALAAIQGVYELLKEQKAEIAALRRELEGLENDRQEYTWGFRKDL